MRNGQWTNMPQMTDRAALRTRDFSFSLDESLIAQKPAQRRDQARLMVELRYAIDAYECAAGFAARMEQRRRIEKLTQVLMPQLEREALTLKAW